MARTGATLPLLTRLTPKIHSRQEARGRPGMIRTKSGSPKSHITAEFSSETEQNQSPFITEPLCSSAACQR